jgi:luciferase family oxidoreductase group 1
VAEHHGSSSLASVAPEVLVAYLLAATRRIRIGTGGVMLQHYSPFKVAEVFRVLENLAPGRVDLGVGKAPGGLPATTRALQSLYDQARKPTFDAAFEELDGFLRDALPEGHPLAAARAKPDIARLPDRVLLGASPEGAGLAARLDWGFCYAGHFNGDPASIERAFAAYAPASGRRPQLALFAVAAASRERAAELAGELKLFTTAPSRRPARQSADVWRQSASLCATCTTTLSLIREWDDKEGVQYHYPAKYQSKIKTGVAPSSISPRPTGTKAPRAPPSMSAANTPSKASLNRWRLRWLSRESA